MSGALVHRGPDGARLAYRAGARASTSAHRRLAILDIAGGDQPMWNEDHDVAVIFNGEIYNHVELREELVSRGHRLRLAIIRTPKCWSTATSNGASDLPSG